MKRFVSVFGALCLCACMAAASDENPAAALASLEVGEYAEYGGAIRVGLPRQFDVGAEGDEEAFLFVGSLRLRIEAINKTAEDITIQATLYHLGDDSQDETEVANEQVVSLAFDDMESVDDLVLWVTNLIISPDEGDTILSQDIVDMDLAVEGLPSLGVEEAEIAWFTIDSLWRDEGEQETRVATRIGFTGEAHFLGVAGVETRAINDTMDMRIALTILPLDQ